MLEKIKEFWNNHKTGIIVTMVAILLIPLIIVIVNLTYQEPKGQEAGIYELLVSWAIWFDPILKTLVGIACIKYILFDW